MPRHRRERVPRYRAQRRAEKSARRARLSAAVTAAATALDAPRPEDATDAAATLPLPAFRLAAGGLGLMSGAVRGLLVTPWFAAATGLVVAAGLWIYSPHAQLKFPPSAIGVEKCQANGCALSGGQGGGALATTGRQPIARPQLAGKSGQPDNGGAAAGLTFSYQVLWNSQGRFGVLIRVTGKHRPRAWKLTFAMPGDEISDVMGADWHPSGTDGGTASGPSDASQWQWPSDGAVTTRHHRRAIGFLVLGQGTPVMPTGCSFNGASCTFS